MCRVGGKLITSPGAGALGSQLSHPRNQRLGWNMGSQCMRGMMLEILGAVVSGLGWQRAPASCPISMAISTPCCGLWDLLRPGSDEFSSGQSCPTGHEHLCHCPLSCMEVAVSWCSWIGKWAPLLMGCPPAGPGLGFRDDAGQDGGPWGTDTFPFPPVELKATGTAHFFNFLLNSSDYRILLKDEDHDRMYVGSKDYVLSLDLHDINREPLIVSCQRRAGGSRWKGVIGHFGHLLDARAGAQWA